MKSRVAHANQNPQAAALVPAEVLAEPRKMLNEATAKGRSYRK